MIDTRTNDPPNTAPTDPTDPAATDAAPAAMTRQQELDAFESEVAEVCGVLHHTHARLVALAADALEHGWWAQSGVRSPEHWLCWQTGVAPAHASRLVAAARRRAELPVTMAAFDAGELSLDQIGPIVARAPEWAEAEVCELAKRCTVSQIRAAVNRYPFAAEESEGLDDGEETPQPAPGHDADGDDGDDPHPDAPEPAAAGGHQEFWSLVDELDGSWRVSGRLDPDHGAILDAAAREIADALFREAGQAPSGVEVLVEMARRSLDSVPDRSRRDRYRVHVLLDERLQLVDPLGCALPTWLRELITCDASMAVTWTRNGTPIAQGSTADTIPAATRRHVLARDGGCRIPGCGRRTRVDVHHIVHREHRGTNDTRNLVAVCPHHHRQHHRGQIRIAGDADRPDGHPDGVVVTDQHGRPIEANRLIRPPSAPPPPVGAYRHPLGERLQTRWVTFNPPSTSRGPRVN